MANPLYSLRQKLADLMGESIVGTPLDNFATSTFGVAKLAVYENDYFNDWNGRFYAGTHKDTSFIVTDFVKASGVVTFGPVVSANTDATDLFEMYKDYTPEELNAAINSAISMVEDEALEETVDESVIIANATYEYAVPAGLDYIEEIYQEQGTTGRYDQSSSILDHRYWQVMRTATGPQIWFDLKFVTLTTGRHLRLMGLKKPTQLVLDADESNVDQTYVIYQAKALLHQKRIRASSSDSEDHERQMVLAQGLALQERLGLRKTAWAAQVTP